MIPLAPRAIRFWSILAATLLADLSTKAWVVSHLGPEGTPHPLLGDVVRFTLTYNDGGALGIDTGPTGLNFLIVLSCALVLGLCVYYGCLPKDSTCQPMALGFLIGGALGNLLDRVGPRPGVVDFIDIGAGSVRFWTFNLADSAIFLGAVMLACWFWQEPHPDPGPPSCTEGPQKAG